MSSPVEGMTRRHRYTVDDYHRMGEAGILRADQRVELIEGEIIDMTPIGSRHAAVVDRLTQLLGTTAGNQAIVRVQNPIALDDLSEPQPDLSLLRPRDDFYAAAHPRPVDVLLVVDVADTSLAFDRDVKIPLYARHGIPEAWLIDLEARRLTVYSEPTANGYRRAREPDTARVALPGLEGAAIDASALLRA